jgi:hypothetical protein
MGETWVEVAKSIHNMTYCWKLHIGENGLGLGSIEDAPTSLSRMMVAALGKK